MTTAQLRKQQRSANELQKVLASNDSDTRIAQAIREAFAGKR